MKIIEIFKNLAFNKTATIGIGLGQDKAHNRKLFEVAKSFVEEYNSNIILFGNKLSANHIFSEFNKDKNQEKIKIDCDENPAKFIIEQLKKQEINAIVRGSISSSEFLSYIKEAFHISTVNRLTLLETAEGHQFFYGPVGIDECNNFNKKKEFIEKALVVFESLKIEPKISVLSGGRRGDLGRDEIVDKTIETADKIVDYFNDINPNLSIVHNEILIEQAIQNKANLVIAPEGISGNLIYRTLVHLGGGKAFGAIYMGLEKVIVDTSRVGHPSEIMGALLLALAMS